MEKIVLDQAIKFGAGRYRQGSAVLEDAGAEIARFSRHPMLLAGRRAFEAVKERLLPSLARAGISEYTLEYYGGYCTYEDAEAIAARARAAGCDEIVGIGGGKVMDMAKAVAETAGVGAINMPTAVSTCAPFACMSVMYTKEGAKKDCWRYSHELDALLLDTTVIANCPVRYSAAGILDAMAKKIEIQNGKPVMRLEENDIDLFSAYRWAEYVYECLRAEGPRAIEDMRAHRVTKAVEDVCFLNVAVTGTIANITQSFRQSAVAHSLYDGVRTLFTAEGQQALHGEIVAVALFTQLHYNRMEADIPQLKEFMRDMRMPLTFAEMGIPSDEAALDKFEAYLIDSPYVGADDDSRALIHEALREL